MENTNIEYDEKNKIDLTKYITDFGEIEKIYDFSPDKVLKSGGKILIPKGNNMTEVAEKMLKLFRTIESDTQIGKMKLICDYDPDYPEMVIRAWGLPD